MITDIKKWFFIYLVCTSIHTFMPQCLFAGSAEDAAVLDSLRRLQPSEIVTKLPDDFTAFRATTADELRHYFFVKAYMDEYLQKHQARLTAQDVVAVLNSIENEHLKGLVIFWIYDAGVHKAFSRTDSEAYYEKLGQIVASGKGKAVEVAVGSMSRIVMDDLREIRKGRQEGQSNVEKRGYDLYEMLVGKIQHGGISPGWKASILIGELHNLHRMNVVTRDKFKETLSSLIRNREISPDVHVLSAKLMLANYPEAETRALLEDAVSTERDEGAKKTIADLLRRSRSRKPTP